MVLLTYISCCAGKEELEKLEEKEESNESGKFKEADEETLKKRRIVKAKGVKKSTDAAKDGMRRRKRIRLRIYSSLRLPTTRVRTRRGQEREDAVGETSAVLQEIQSYENRYL